MKLDADKVRWHRDRRGWTLETAAEQAEVALGTILRAEHGEDIRPSSGRRIARAFGADVSELVPDQPGVVLPKAPAPSTQGQPKEERKFRFEIKPTGPIHVTREDLAEHGISVTDAELRVLNDSLEGYRRGQETGEPYALIVLAEENIDWKRIHRLTTYVVAAGMLAPEETEAVLQGVRDELAATSR